MMNALRCKAFKVTLMLPDDNTTKNDSGSEADWALISSSSPYALQGCHDSISIWRSERSPPAFRVPCFPE